MCDTIFSTNAVKMEQIYLKPLKEWDIKMMRTAEIQTVMKI